MSEYRFFLLHKILVLSINVLVLGALTVAMYVASGTLTNSRWCFSSFSAGCSCPSWFWDSWASVGCAAALSPCAETRRDSSRTHLALSAC
jgi:hypothetical protein